VKSIGISDDVYLDLLHTKHEFEKREGRVISYDEIVKRLIALNGNDQSKEDGVEIKDESSDKNCNKPN